MKHFFLFFTCLFSIHCTYSQTQDIQWAFKVLDFSSQKENHNFSATQVLGRPNVYPSSGENKNAWEPKNLNSEQFIKVGFRIPEIPKQLVIVETFNPGAIEQVFVYDASGKEYEVTSFTAHLSKELNNVLIVKTKDINFHVLAVKIVLRSSANIEGIDAIGMTTSSKTIQLPKPTENELIKSNMTVTKLDSSINSPYQEMGPLVSPDGKRLYFSRRGDPSDKGGKGDMEDIWYAEWNDTTKSWGTPVNIGPPLNTTGPNFINSISPDGNSVLLGNSYNDDGTMGDGVSVSHKTANGWSFPEKLTIEQDENINPKANFFLSNSQKIMLLSEEHKRDNSGNRDLYVSFKSSDGTWTPPINLGRTVNTTGTEEAPFLASDDKTLYFASDGHNGYGGLDLYVTRRMDDSWNNWTVPENLGPVVNTSHNESFLSIPASGDRIYFTSERDSSGDEDIYALEPAKLIQPTPVTLINGRVLNSKTLKPIEGVKIFFEDLSNGKEMGVASSSPGNGNYQIALPSAKRYGYLAVKDGYISVNNNIDLSGQQAYQQVQKDLYLTPIEAGELITLHNVFFDFDKYTLRKESYYELNRLSEVLKKHPDMTIEISGYADSIGTKTYNDKLSEKRAEAVAQYLMKQSSATNDRIHTKHYGELHPASSNKTAQGRQMNRRVEFKILSH